MIDELIRISKAGIWFSISGMLTVAFIYCIWGLGEDIYSEFKEYKLETAYSSDDVYVDWLMKYLSMIVEGKAEGELNVNDVLNIKSEGNVNGKIFYGEIQIEEGGKLSGEINHRDKNNKQEEFKDLKVSWC